MAGPVQGGIGAPLVANMYAGGVLDRAAHWRGNADWLAQAWREPRARVVPVWRGQTPLRLRPDGTREAVMPPARWAADQVADGAPWAFLGLLEEAPIFGVGLEGEVAPDAVLPDGHGRFAGLRDVLGVLGAADAALIGYARAVMHWRARHRFCGVCGAACVAGAAGHELRCSGCDARHFPRTDPAVIMLVTHGDRVLLGRSVRFADRNLYSTLAGFVEPGESLEEAVIREVGEETGVMVGTPRYRSSQPWPFPANIMLGFEAPALSSAITIDPAELVDAAWFGRGMLHEPRAHGFELPPVDSIAHRLITDWLER